MRPTGIHGRVRHVVERLRPPGAEVENAVAIRVLQKPQVDGDHVVDKNKIARLLSGSIAAVLAEQLHFTGVAVLVEMMESDRGHAALVLLAGTVDVEVSKARHLRSGGGQHPSYDVVEQ